MLTPARKKDVVAGSALAASATLGTPVAAGAAFAADLAALRKRGVRFVVLHERFVPGSVRDALGAALRDALGSPMARAGGRVAWDLGPIPDGPPAANPEHPRAR